MTKRGRIGVLTFHKCINYGSYWQARCLAESLQARGFEVDLLDHHCDCVQRAEIRCAFHPKLPERSSRAEIRGYSVKVRKFARAISGLPLSRRFSLHEPETAGPYDQIVVGSDEVWNLRHPWYGQKPIFYGVGLQARKLVSYGASFGNHDASDGLHPWWAEQLRRFDAISVRDSNSHALVEGSTSLAPETVLDPCLQYPDPIMTTATGTGEGKFALVYGHGFPAWLGRAARKWADERGYKLVSVGYSNDFADEQRVDAGPMEFAALASSASAVITNFFHGAVFSLVNSKPFVAVPMPYRLNKLRDLTTSLASEHRLLLVDPGERGLKALLQTPPEPPVVARIAEHRARSSAFLDAALA